MRAMKTEVLKTSTLSALGVSIEQIELRCTSCRESFMTPAPLASGKFPHGWHECPNGCNRKAA